MLGIIEIAAASGALHCKFPDRAGRKIIAVIVDDLGAVSRNGFTGGAWANVVARSADKDLQDLGGADAVDDPDAGSREPRVVSRTRQSLAGGNAFLQRGEIMPGKQLQHCAISGRRSEAYRRAMLDECCQKLWR